MYFAVTAHSTLFDYLKGNLYYFFTIHDETHESYSKFMYVCIFICCLTRGKKSLGTRLRA